MAYAITWSATISWVGDGTGQMNPAPASPMLKVDTGFAGNGGQIQVPGGDAPSTANISTACTTAGTNMATALNAQIGRIQGWANGSTT